MSKKLWGAIFSKKTHPLVEKFTSSVAYDQRLAKYDCLGSIAHAKMLGKCKIIPAKDASKIVLGLQNILSQIEKGKFNIDSSAEDIHSVIHDALEKEIGQAALKLHTARSRNDQVSLDTRMYCKDAINDTISLIGKLQDVVSNLGKKHAYLVMPGFTHLQHAQPVLFDDYLFAYIEMLNRDKKRLSESCDRCDSLPLGSCALTGTTLPIDRNCVAKLLGFSKISTSTLDAVSDRDFVIETLGVLSLIGMHLSRLAEDFIIFSTKEFDFIEIGDEFCTGSSLMPQKKNPDVLELIRGYAARLSGNYTSVISLMKGLPLAYNRDMQLDKEPLFNSFDIVQGELGVLAELVKSVKVNKNKISAQLEDESLYATDVAEFLVKQGVSFREAHEIVGKLVRHSLNSSINIKDMGDKELKKFSEKLNRKDIIRLIDPQSSVKSKKR